MRTHRDGFRYHIYLRDERDERPPSVSWPTVAAVVARDAPDDSAAAGRVLRTALGLASAGGGSAPEPPLTERQRQVLRLLAKGASNRDIALALRISVNGVKGHLKALWRKLGICSSQPGKDLRGSGPDQAAPRFAAATRNAGLAAGR